MTMTIQDIMTMKFVDIGNDDNDNDDNDDDDDNDIITNKIVI